MRIFPLVIVVASSFACATIARGAVEWQLGGDDQPTVIRIAVTPVAAAKIAPLVASGTQDGNGAPIYREAIGLYEAARQKHVLLTEDELARWNDPMKPLDPAAAAKVDAWLADLKPALDKAVAATQMRSCDWQFGEDKLRGLDYFTVDASVFDSMRKLSRAVNLQARRAIAQKRFDDALSDVRVNVRMARDLVTCKLLLCGLIGAQILEISGHTTLELMAAPGAPSISQSLGALPRPLIDLRPGIKFELASGYQLFPLIDRPETTERTPQQWNEELRRTLERLLEISAMNAEQPTGARLAPGHVVMGIAYSMGGYTHARRMLLSEGMSAEQIEPLAVGKVIALGAARAYRKREQAHAALLDLPYQEFVRRRAALEQQLDEEHRQSLAVASDRILPIAELVIGPATVGYSRQVGLDRSWAALEVVAALRAHAAANGGKLPASLADVKAVNVPVNPATGEAFAYRLDGERAVLELPRSDGFPDGYRYEISIAPPAAP